MASDEIIKRITDIAVGITQVKDVYVSEKNLTIDYITLFSHSDSELADLITAGKTIGKQIDEHNGPVFRLNRPITFPNGTLKYFRIRKPDIKRPQIGCGDFKVADYESFKNKYLGQKNFELFHGGGFDYLGIHDMTQDYLVYFPDKAITESLGR